MSFSKNILFYVVIFALSLGYILALKYPYERMGAGYDPYYHAAHARSYLNQEAFNYPQFTYFKEHPADPWLGYHLMLASVFALAPNQEPATLIRFSIIGHAVLSSILIATIAWFLVCFMRRFIPHYRGEVAKKFSLFSHTPPAYYAAAATTLLTTLLLAPGFTFRALLIERPHVLMMLLVTLGYIALIKQKHHYLALLGFLAPLFYSLSLFIFLPSIIPLIGWLAVDRTRRTIRECIFPLGYTCIGYVTGVLLHTDTLGYLINGVGFHTYAVLQSLLLRWVPGAQSELVIPSEMLEMSHSVMSAVIITATILLVSILLYRVRKQSSIDASTNKIIEVGLISLAAFLSIATLFIVRLTEYSILLMGAVIATFIYGYIAPSWANLHPTLMNRTNEAAALYRSTYSILLKHTKDKSLIYIAGFLIILLVIGVTRSEHSALTNGLTEGNQNKLLGALEIIKKHNHSGVTMFNSFHLYPQSVFYAPNKLYSTGFDSRMTYFYNSELDAHIAQFWKGNSGCDLESSCHDFSVDTIPGFMIDYNVTLILVDTTFLSEAQIKTLSSYTFLELIYVDTFYPEIQLYKVDYIL